METRLLGLSIFLNQDGEVRHWCEEADRMYRREDIYPGELVITLDELPDLKTYPIR